MVRVSTPDYLLLHRSIMDFTFSLDRQGLQRVAEPGQKRVKRNGPEENSAVRKGAEKCEPWGSDEGMSSSPASLPPSRFILSLIKEAPVGYTLQQKQAMVGKARIPSERSKEKEPCQHGQSECEETRRRQERRLKAAAKKAAGGDAG
ncbi:hypothetical protein Tco_0866350 [Tanacetum coccineum]